MKIQYAQTGLGQNYKYIFLLFLFPKRENNLKLDNLEFIYLTIFFIKFIKNAYLI